MVAPVVGPFRRTTERLGAYGELRFYQNRWWNKQSKPYNLPLAFSLDQRSVESFSSNGWRDTTTSGEGDIAMMDSLIDLRYNDAYEKFVNRARTTASWAVTFAERKQAVSMITNRGLQLAKFANSVRRLDFSGASRALNLNKIPKGVKKRGKSVGNNFLEYHFGWVPLVKDIGNSIEILQEPVHIHPIKVKKTGPDNWTGGYNDGYNDSRSVYSVRSTVTIGGNVRLTNSDALLANQMGFINPLTIAWELVPFSFVVDWFTNVGQVLSSMTDLVGLQLENAYITRFQERRHNIYNSYYTGLFWNGGYKGVYVRRIPVSTLPGPTLRFNPPERLSISRAATSISLLLQRLK